jgi:hypothetical protein
LSAETEGIFNWTKVSYAHRWYGKVWAQLPDEVAITRSCPMKLKWRVFFLARI